MTKGEYLKSKGIDYMSHVDPNEETTPDFIALVESLVGCFGEIYEDAKEGDGDGRPD